MQQRRPQAYSLHERELQGRLNTREEPCTFQGLGFRASEHRGGAKGASGKRAPGGAPSAACIWPASSPHALVEVSMGGWGVLHVHVPTDGVKPQGRLQ